MNDLLKTPLGTLYLAASEEGLTHASFEKSELPESTESSPQASKALELAKRELSRYFSGESDALEQVPLSEEGSPFQKSVWKALRKTKAGETLSYSSLASKTDSPQAVRATASACASNPILIFNPCHRVVRKDGGLGGFRGGLQVKQELLKLESTGQL